VRAEIAPEVEASTAPLGVSGVGDAGPPTLSSDAFAMTVNDTVTKSRTTGFQSRGTTHGAKSKAHVE